MLSTPVSGRARIISPRRVVAALLLVPVLPVVTQLGVDAVRSMRDRRRTSKNRVWAEPVTLDPSWWAQVDELADRVDADRLWTFTPKDYAEVAAMQSTAGRLFRFSEWLNDLIDDANDDARTLREQWVRHELPVMYTPEPPATPPAPRLCSRVVDQLGRHFARNEDGSWSYAAASTARPSWDINPASYSWEALHLHFAPPFRLLTDAERALEEQSA